jgi:hypothetical protein
MGEKSLIKFHPLGDIISRRYKELKNLNTKITNNSNSKWTNNLNTFQMKKYK